MRSIAITCLVLLLFGCSRSTDTEIPRVPELKGHETLRLNQIQVLGTHNSYSQGLDWILAKGMGKRGDAIDGLVQGLSEQQGAWIRETHPNPGTMADWLNYLHAPLAQQLDGGMRSIELDVYIDPDGGRFLNPASRHCKI